MCAAVVWWGSGCHEAALAAPRSAPSGAPSAQALEIPSPLPAKFEPLYGFRHRCQDPRYPRLAGPWVVGCGTSGRVDRARNLEDGREIELNHPAVSPGTGQGVLFAMGQEHGLWRLPLSEPEDAWPTNSTPARAPPAVDGRHVALVLDGSVSTFTLGEPVRRSRDAAPLPWFAPALAWPWVYWVDGSERDRSGMDIWAWNAEEGRPMPWVVAPGDQRHVAASGDWVGWLDDSGVHLQQRSTGECFFHAADTGFRAGLALDESVACWEERGVEGFAVQCSDGLEVRGRDAGWPSRWGRWLLVRIQGVPWLFTVTEEASAARLDDAPSKQGVSP